MLDYEMRSCRVMMFRRVSASHPTPELYATSTTCLVIKTDSSRCFANIRSYPKQALLPWLLPLPRGEIDKILVANRLGANSLRLGSPRCWSDMAL